MISVFQEILSSHEDQLDALHAASAFHRLARLGQLTTHPTLLELWQAGSWRGQVSRVSNLL